MIKHFALGIFAAASLAAAPIVFSAQLDGASESPSNASPGTGTALVTFDTATHTMRVQVSFSGLLGATTVAHIHCCTANAFDLTQNAGVATTTPTFPGFPAGVMAGSYDQTFDMMLSGSYRPQFLAGFGGNTAAAEAALLQGALDGKAYFNIHSTSFPAGEIRGFLQETPEPGTYALTAAALAGLAFLRRRR